MHYPTLRHRLSQFRFLNPKKAWDLTHLSRRAGVLIVLEPLGKHDLNVVLTLRSQHVSYAADAALPGGKADTLEESMLKVAMREANEEIGLNASEVRFVNQMPGYLSSQLVMVVPSIVWLLGPNKLMPVSSNEVAKVFKLPLSRFLSAEGHEFRTGRLKNGGIKKVHYFRWLAANKRVGDSKYDCVWGLTAQILVDCAKVAFQSQPEFETSGEMGSMPLINKLVENGTLASPKQKI